MRTVTADNGSELTAWPVIEERLETRFFFAAPYHAWERGTNENTNGLVRQYLPKRSSMASLTQHDCNRIARSSIAGPANGSAFAPRSNAMKASCCTSHLNSHIPATSMPL